MVEQAKYDRRPKCIVGLGYGDEGKGMTVAKLAYDRKEAGDDPVVVRYNGGPQAAHNVRINGMHHTFSQLGAGTLSGAGTVLAATTLVQPFLLMHEIKQIIGLTGRSPMEDLTIDPAAPLLLPMHSQFNRALETRRGDKRHGSTGMGIGVARDYELSMDESGKSDSVPRVSDLSDPFALADKMQAQAEWLSNRWDMDFGYDRKQAEKHATDMHLIYADLTANGARFRTASEALMESRWTPEDIIFEGSQGILLDLRYGFFPHVTYGWLDAGNADKLCEASGLPKPVVVGCTRTYSTRHGAGPFPPEGTADISETDNATGVWQGAFRTGLFDLPMFEYAVSIVKPDVISLSCEDLYPGKIIEEWKSSVDSVLDPKDYALAADDAIRREDDDDKWDPNSVYAPLVEASPLIVDKSLDGLKSIITNVSGAPIVIDGYGAKVEDWRSKNMS